MIISVEDAKKLIQFGEWNDEKIARKLLAIEQTIRTYTNNNFQNRNIRGEFVTDGVRLSGGVIGFRVGDTVQISDSLFNDGLYVIDAVYDAEIALDKDLTEETGKMLVTKVQYPEDVVECCLSLLEWSIKHSSKVGIKSETLSRHSVTYEDSATLFNGYPVGILNGLKLHKKVRC